MKAVLFDLDGVLIDTESQYTRFWETMGKGFMPDVPDLALRVKGQTLTHIYEHYFPDPTIQEQISTLLVEFESQMNYNYVGGALEFVTELRDKGILTAIVTSSNREKMRQLYRSRPELPSLFSLVRTAEDAQRSKPAPDCYITAAHALGAEPQQCIVFEDSINGLRAAQGSGATVVALTTSLSHDEVAPFAHHVIADFRGHHVEDFISKLGLNKH